jgi:CheY-like chemotaxis protein
MDIASLELVRATTRGAHRLTWGLGYRHARDRSSRGLLARLQPDQRDLEWAHAFVQDDIALSPQLIAHLGMRLDTNSYTGLEVLPTARLSYTPEVEVDDSGIAIAADLLPHVFDLFVQGERTPDRSQGGLGIGLALVRALVSLHGGRISAHSDGPGRGSRFTLTLPATTRRTSPSTPAGPAVLRASCLRVLVADDNIDAADSMSALLAEVGHSVHVAYTGNAAITAATQGPFDVYILDIGLPDMTSYQLIERIKAAGVGERAYFIAATGYAQQHDRDATRAAGFHRHLIKPVEPTQLLELLDGRAELSTTQPTPRDVIARGPPETRASTGRGR